MDSNNDFFFNFSPEALSVMWCFCHEKLRDLVVFLFILNLGM